MLLLYSFWEDFLYKLFHIRGEVINKKTLFSGHNKIMKPISNCQYSNFFMQVMNLSKARAVVIKDMLVVENESYVR